MIKKNHYSEIPLNFTFPAIYIAAELFPETFYAQNILKTNALRNFFPF